MYRFARPLSILFLIVGVTLTVSGCITTDYVGRTYAPTAQVDLYFDAADLNRDYEVMGEVTAESDAQNPFVPAEKVQRKLIRLAQSKGADALLFSPMDVRASSTTGTETTEGRVKDGRIRSNTVTTTTVDEVRVLRAQLLKYKPQVQS